MKTKLVSTMLIISLLLVGVASTGAAQEKTEIDFWYALSGSIAETTVELVEKFNESHPDIQVNAVQKGSYTQALTSAVAAYRSGNPPSMVQVYDTGTQTMLDSGVIYPLWKLIDKFDLNIDTKSFITPIRANYEIDGKLSSMPFNASSPIMYYNKDAFKEAGLDPNDPPRTFAEIEEMGQQLIENSDVKYALTTGWNPWVLIENMHTWHDQPLTNNKNGFDGRATEYYVNGPFSVKIFETLRDWQKEDIYTYQGRKGDPNPAFLGGDVAMVITSTGYLSGFLESSNFELGTTYMPHMQGYPKGKPEIGGGTIWAFKGQSEKELRATGKFFEFLSKPESQVYWHKNTGYFPASNEATRALLDSGFFAEHPHYLTAFMQMITGVTTPRNKGVRLGNYASIKRLLRNQIEAVFAGQGTPQEVLDRAAKQVNESLAEYTEGIED